MGVFVWGLAFSLSFFGLSHEEFTHSTTINSPLTALNQIQSLGVGALLDLEGGGGLWWAVENSIRCIDVETYLPFIADFGCFVAVFQCRA